MEIKKQPIGNGYHFDHAYGSFMAYRDRWWMVHFGGTFCTLAEPTPEQQAWLDTFTEIIKGS